MGHQTRFSRRRMYRPARQRCAWHLVRKAHVRRGLQALDALYHRG